MELPCKANGRHGGNSSELVMCCGLAYRVLLCAFVCLLSKISPTFGHQRLLPVMFNALSGDIKDSISNMWKNNNEYLL